MDRAVITDLDVLNAAELIKLYARMPEEVHLIEGIKAARLATGRVLAVGEREPAAELQRWPSLQLNHVVGYAGPEFGDHISGSD